MKIISKILSILLVLILTIAVSSCSSKVDKTGTSRIIEEDSIDLKGKTFVFTSCLTVPGEEAQNYLNEQIGKKLNCKLEWRAVDYNYFSKQMILDIKAGKFDSHIISLRSVIPLAQICKDKLLIPLDEYLDFKSSPFNKQIQNAGLWQGKHYGLNYSILSAPINFMFYDKNIIAQSGFEDLFSLQQKNQWTWDTFLELTKKIAVDKNGDGRPDIWGCVVPNSATLFYSLIYSNDGMMTKERKDGSFECTLNDTKTVKAINFFNELANVHKTMFTPASSDLDICKKIMEEGKGAVYAYSSNPLVENKDRLGMISYPKGPDAEMYANVNTAGNIYAIPCTVKNPDEAARVLKELYTLTIDYDKYIESLPRMYPNQNDAEIVKSAIENVHYVYYDATLPFQKSTSYLVTKIMQNIGNTLNIDQTISESVEIGNDALSDESYNDFINKK